MKRGTQVKKRYISPLDRDRTLSQLLAEDRMKEEKERKKIVKVKVPKKKFISCADCDNFTLTRKDDNGIHGIFNCKGHCINL